MNEAVSIIQFKDYKINRVEFHINRDLLDQETEVTFAIQRSILINPKVKDIANVMLSIMIPEEDRDRVPFCFDISMIGIFDISKAKKEDLKNLLEINAVAILLPYLRSYLTTITANANIKPFILPTINVARLGEETPEELVEIE